MKMYNKPATEVMDLKTASLMQGITTMSPAGGNGPGGTEAPALRGGGDIID